MHITEAVRTTEAIPTTEAIRDTEHRTTPPLAFPVDDPDLAAALEQAEAARASNEAVAIEAEQRAAAALDAFRSNPAPDLHGTAAAQEQIAANAREQARQSAERAAALASEQTRRQKVALLQELEPAASRDRLFSQATEAVCALASELHPRLAEVSLRLLANLDAHRGAVLESERLASELGVFRRDRRPVTLPELNQWLATQLAEAFPARHFRHPVWGGRVDGPARFTIQFDRVHDGSLVAQVGAAEYLDTGERAS